MKFGYTALQWMEWRMWSDSNLSIQHQFNEKEKRISYEQLPVDSFDEETMQTT